MYEIKVVTAEEARGDKKFHQKLLELMRIKTRDMGAHINDKEVLLEWKNLVENSYDRIEAFFCAYKEGEFVGFLVLRKVVLHTDSPMAFSVTSVNFPKSLPLLDWSKPHPWKDALDAVSLYMKERQVWDIYWVQTNRPAIQRQWKTRTDMMRYCAEWYDEETDEYKWHRYVEEALDPGERPASDLLFQSTMMRKLYDFPIVIRRFTLKNQYRPYWHKVSSWWTPE